MAAVAGLGADRLPDTVMRLDAVAAVEDRRALAPGGQAAERRGELRVAGVKVGYALSTVAILAPALHGADFV